MRRLTLVAFITILLLSSCNNDRVKVKLTGRECKFWDRYYKNTQIINRSLEFCASGAGQVYWYEKFTNKRYKFEDGDVFGEFHWETIGRNKLQINGLTATILYLDMDSMALKYDNCEDIDRFKVSSQALKR